MGGGASVETKKVNEELKAVKPEDLTGFVADLDAEQRKRLQALLGVPAEVPAFNRAAQELLWKSAVEGKVDDIAIALRDGASVDMFNDGMKPGLTAGLSAMMYAARAGMPPALRVLAKNGAQLDLGNKDGWTAIHFACANKRKMCLGTLIELGANFAALTIYKRNALDILEEEQADLEETEDAPDTKLLVELMDVLKAKGLSRSHQGEMYKASRSGDVAELRAAVAGGATVNLRNVSTRTALSFAAEKGQPKCIAVLKELAADLEGVDQDEWTAMHFAAAAGEPECLEELIKLGANLQAITKFKRNAIDLVSEDLIDNPPESKDDPRKRCVSFLREKGLKTTAHSDLFRAAKVGEVDALKEALKHGADINLTNAASFTSFMCAADMGHDDILKVLEEHSADMEATDRDGWTAVHFAAFNGQAKTLNGLVMLGAKVDSVTHFKRNPMDLAEDRLTYDLDDEQRESYKEIVRFLKNKDLKPSPQGQLWKHARKGDVDGCRQALADGAELNFRDFEENSAADHAHGNKHEDCLKFLIEQGAVWEG